MTAATDARAGRTSMPNALKSGHLPRWTELWILLGSAVLVGLIFIPLNYNLAGGLIVMALLYLVAIGVISRVVENRRQAIDRIVRALVTIAFILAMIPLVSTLWTVIANGIGQMNWSFVSQTGGSVFNPETLEVTQEPGALQAIVGTLIITGIAAVISIPIGILTAVWLTEYSRPGHAVRRIITFLVDVMTGIPSIVAGLFAFSLFALIVGPKAFSGFSAAIALCVLMIPTVVRSSEEMIRLVPNELREASYALGVTKYHTIIKVVLRTAFAGLVTGVVLAVARVIGETAPIFIAASFTDNFNANPFEGPMQTLPVLAYTGYKFPTTNPEASLQSAWGAALLLVLLVIVFNLIARIVARYFAPKTRR